jgi:hypothetical protein
MSDSCWLNTELNILFLTPCFKKLIREEFEEFEEVPGLISPRLSSDPSDLRTNLFDAAQTRKENVARAKIIEEQKTNPGVDTFYETCPDKNTPIRSKIFTIFYNIFVKETPSFDRYDDVMKPLAFQVINTINHKPTVDEAFNAHSFGYVIDQLFKNPDRKKQVKLIKYQQPNIPLPVIKEKVNIIMIYYYSSLPTLKKNMLDTEGFTLESAFLTMSFKKNIGHSVACLTCNGIQYIYDSQLSTPILCNWKDVIESDDFIKTLCVAYSSLSRINVLKQREKMRKLDWDGLRIEHDHKIIDMKELLDEQSIDRLETIKSFRIVGSSIKRVNGNVSPETQGKLNELLTLHSAIKLFHEMQSNPVMSPYGEIDSAILHACVYVRKDMVCMDGGKK